MDARGMQIASALLGYCVLGGCTALVSGRWLPLELAVVVPAGAALACTPSLLVVSRLSGVASGATGIVVSAWSGAGRLCGWSAPVVLFFAAGGRMAGEVFDWTLGAAGLVALIAIILRLAEAGPPARAGRTAAVGAGWTVVTWLVATRLVALVGGVA